MTVDPSVQPDLLESIVSAMRRAVHDREVRCSVRALEGALAGRIINGQCFVDALRRTTGCNVIAECKRRSPSRGLIRSDYVAVDLACEYAAAGASAISVVTEPAFFDGKLEDLEAVCGRVEIPVLCKDFIVSEYQILEAALGGASAVLLIAAALDERTLCRLMGTARDIGITVLAEVHNDFELDRALGAGADVIGVNNRNLRTLTVDLGVCERIVEHIPTNVVAIAESGLRSASDLIGLSKAGYDAFLIGESFLVTPEPGATLAGLLSKFERCSVETLDANR